MSLFCYFCQCGESGIHDKIDTSVKCQYMYRLHKNLYTCCILGSLAICYTRHKPWLEWFISCILFIPTYVSVISLHVYYFLLLLIIIGIGCVSSRGMSSSISGSESYLKMWLPMQFLFCLLLQRSSQTSLASLFILIEIRTICLAFSRPTGTNQLSFPKKKTVRHKGMAAHHVCDSEVCHIYSFTLED